MWNSVSLLQILASWSLIVALVSAILAAVAGTIGTVASTRAADLTIRQANIRIAEANARAEEAKEAAAKAGEESARLQLEMERERTARLKLEEKVQPRKISKEQAELIKTSLTNAPRGKVFINPDWANPESKLFAAQIATVLEPLGFPLERLQGDSAPLSYGRLGTFFVIRDGSDPPSHLKPLHDAFRTAGLLFDVHAEVYVPDNQSILIGVSSH